MSTHERSHLLFLSVTGSDPPRSWRSGIGKGWLPWRLNEVARRGARPRWSTWHQQGCAVRKRVTGKTRRTVYPCIDAGVNTSRNVLLTARSVPVEGMKPGEMNGVHRALRFCSVLQPALRRVGHLAMAHMTACLRGFGQYVDVGVKRSEGGIPARNVYKDRKSVV